MAQRGMAQPWGGKRDGQIPVYVRPVILAAEREMETMSATVPVHGKSSGVATVLRVTSGNFLEMFDFFLFGFYATYISKAFFPTGSEFAGLMLTFMTFGAGFLMRPLGAIILGAYIDQIGRRKGLILTLTIMASGTFLIAFVPGYATIGMAAPVLVL